MLQVLLKPAVRSHWSHLVSQLLIARALGIVAAALSAHRMTLQAGLVLV